MRSRHVWLKCCQLLQNACKCSIYIRICFRIYLSVSVSVSVDVFSVVFVTSFAHLDTLRFISSTKCAKFFCCIWAQQKQSGWRDCRVSAVVVVIVSVSCTLIELPDLRINWHSNANIETNWAADANAQRIQLESYLNLFRSRNRCPSRLGASKLYGQQLGNAFKSIDKMKCNPLAVAKCLQSIPKPKCNHIVFADCTEFCINFNATLDQTNTRLSHSSYCIHPPFTPEYRKSADTSGPNKLLVINSPEKIFSTCQKLLWTIINEQMALQNVRHFFVLIHNRYIVYIYLYISV